MRRICFLEQIGDSFEHRDCMVACLKDLFMNLHVNLQYGLVNEDLHERVEKKYGKNDADRI